MRSGTETLKKMMTMLVLLAGAVNAIAHEPQSQCNQSPPVDLATYVFDEHCDSFIDEHAACADMYSSLKEQLKQDLPRYQAAREATSRGLRWTLLESDTYSSRIEVLRGDRSLGTYSLNCDVSPEANELEFDLSIHEINRADIVSSKNDGSYLLVVVCNHGAHSREISIFDTSRRSDEPAWSKVGSYFADWQLIDGDLCISYDLPCTDDVCDQPFVTTEVSWNALTDQGLMGCGEK